VLSSSRICPILSRLSWYDGKRVCCDLLGGEVSYLNVTSAMGDCSDAGVISFEEIQPFFKHSSVLILQIEDVEVCNRRVSNSISPVRVMHLSRRRLHFNELDRRRDYIELAVHRVVLQAERKQSSAVRRCKASTYRYMALMARTQNSLRNRTRHL
jgi:hypothetical protein